MADLKFKNLPSEIRYGDDLDIEIPLKIDGKFVSIDGNINIFIQQGTKKQTINLDKNLTISESGYKIFTSLDDVNKNKNSLSFKIKESQESGFFQIWGDAIIKKNSSSETVDIDLQVFEVTLSESAKDLDKSKMIPKQFENQESLSRQSFPPNIQKVSLVEPGRNNTDDQFLWVYIRNGVLDFSYYKKFIDEVMCNPNLLKDKKKKWENRLPFNQVDAFNVLKFATDYYMKKFFRIIDSENSNYDNTIIKKSANETYGLHDEEARTNRTLADLSNVIFEAPNNVRESYWIGGKDYLPYFETILERLKPFKVSSVPNSWCGDSIKENSLEDLNLLELIWSYWHEEGGLVQTMNAISLRFQNVRLNTNDPLAGLNIDPLRPINNLIWGYIEDERNRLSMSRRNLEYQYEYGISLIGKAVANIQVAESRSQFLPAFHNLLKTAIDFYQQANYTTVIPDGFPVLNSLREVHLLLSEGSHNQFGSLPWAARAEMFIQQWLLSRPEMREFLGGRIMMPYNEEWMDKVDTMKTIQGWNPTNITHFHDLGAFGEQLLLSIRYGSWNDPSQTRDNAANWAYYWREEIQRYVHAYKAATGVDLGNDVTDARIAMPQNVERYTQPSVLIGRRVNSLPNNRPSQLNRLTQRRNLERY